MTNNTVTPIRVLHVVGQMNVGGAELRMLDMLRHTSRTRFELNFCTISSGHGDLDEEIRALGSAIYPTPLGLSFFRSFTTLLKETKPDVVHAHVHYASGMIMRLAAKEGVPVRVTHFRSSSDARPATFKRKIQKRVLKHWIDRYATDILAVSEASMEGIWGTRKSDDPRYQVVYNGRDLEEYRRPSVDRHTMRKHLGLPSSSLVVVHIGRFAAAKNHEALINVFGCIRRMRIDSHLLLVGDGPRERSDKLRAQILKLGLQNCVHLLGSRRDVSSILKAADVMVFPSLWEGLPGAVVEACAAGLPVIASDIPSVSEVARVFPDQVCKMSLERDNETAWAASAIRAVKSNACGQMKLTTELSADNPFAMASFLNRLGAIWSRSRPYHS